MITGPPIREISPSLKGFHLPFLAIFTISEVPVSRFPVTPTISRVAETPLLPETPTAEIPVSWPLNIQQMSLFFSS